MQAQQKQYAKQIIYPICKTIKEHFPTLPDQIDNQIEDPRKRKEYTLAEIVLAAVMMFLFREGSRNKFNEDRRQETFIKNYERLFKLRMPHMDTVEDVLRLLPPTALEQLIVSLVKALFEKKVFHKYKFLGKYFMVAIDGTGVHTYEEQHCEECLHKTHGEKTTYFHHVLEAKLIVGGMAISLGSEWIANSPDLQFDKQDCEHKAFKRLADKLKKAYPRLPICIVADGLYPNKTFFEICRQHQWFWIVTFKEGNLPSVQEEIKLLLPLTQGNKTTWASVEKTKRITQTYRWINDIEYKGTILHWVECEEETVSQQTGEVQTNRFVCITNLEITAASARSISTGGRLRWKIENEGFNMQKNNGYNLEHKYSRVSFTALKNYYQCLQLAHLINQLVENSADLEALLHEFTLTYLWESLLKGFLRWIDLDQQELNHLYQKRWQIRLKA